MRCATSDDGAAAASAVSSSAAARGAGGGATTRGGGGGCAAAHDRCSLRSASRAALALAVAAASASDASRSALSSLLHGRSEVDLLTLLLSGALATAAAGALAEAGEAADPAVPDAAEACAAASLLRGLCLSDASCRTAALALGAVEVLLSAAEKAAGSVRAAARGALEALLSDGCEDALRDRLTALAESDALREVA